MTSFIAVLASWLQRIGAFIREASTFYWRFFTFKGNTPLWLRLSLIGLIVLFIGVLYWHDFR